MIPAAPIEAWRRARTPEGWAIAGGVVAAGFVVTALAGPHPFDGRGGAMAAITAAVITAAWRPGKGWGTPTEGWVTAPLALVVVPFAVGVAAGGRTAIPLATVTAVAATGTASRQHRPDIRIAGTALAGGAALVAALLSSHAGRPGWGLAPSGRIQAVALIVAGVGLLASSGRDRRSGPRLVGLEPLAAAGVVVGLVGAPQVPEAGLPLAVLATASAALRRPLALTMGVAAFALATVPGAGPAAALLAAAAALATVLPPAIADGAGLPAVVAAGHLVVSSSLGGRPAATVAVLGLATALTVLRPRPPLPGWPPQPAVVPALVGAGWLTLAPSGWTWVGGAVVGYDRAAAIAVAVAALTATALRLRHSDLWPERA